MMIFVARNQSMVGGLSTKPVAYYEECVRTEGMNGKGDVIIPELLCRVFAQEEELSAFVFPATG